MKRIGLIVALLCAMVFPAGAQELAPYCKDCLPEASAECPDEDQPNDRKERDGKKSREEMFKEIQEFKLKSRSGNGS